MEKFLSTLTEINNSVNEFVWIKIGLILLLSTGVIMTLLTKVFQISHIKVWWNATIGGLFSKSAHKKSDKGSVSQFQALCTALAATIGTGNIAGVAAAIAVGGPGAVFWMWLAAFFGMMTNYSENVLGIYFRRKNENGEWSGGAMYYLQHGLGGYKHMKIPAKVLAVLFSVFAILASFGIGNIGQINKITINLQSAFFPNSNTLAFGNVKLVSLLIGIALMILAAVVIFGGLQRIAATAEKIVPFMAVAYIVGCLIIFFCHISRVGLMFTAIFKFAFGVKAVTGGVTGIALKAVVTQGFKRGVFSNEAGLGSSVMVHSASNVKEPVIQGMWGIFEVFADTFVVCTMTAIVVLSSGAIDLQTGLPVNAGEDGATLVASAFRNIFGRPGEMFVAIAVLMFAFTTVLGWSHYGSKSVEYLFGVKASKYYKVVFVLAIVSGAILTSSIAWDISDTFNGLMMVPNLIGVLALSPVVKKITQNYVDRKVKNKKIEPMLSVIPDIQKEYAQQVMSEESQK